MSDGLTGGRVYHNRCCHGAKTNPAPADPRSSLSMSLESPPIDDDSVESDWHEEDKQILVILIVCHRVEELEREKADERKASVSGLPF